MSIIKARIDDVLRILGNFKDERDPTHARSDYLSLLVNDFGFYYGYNEYLIEKFLQVLIAATRLIWQSSNNEGFVSFRWCLPWKLENFLMQMRSLDLS